LKPDSLGARIDSAAVKNMKGMHELSPLLIGPVAVLSIPTVSPEHMKVKAGSSFEPEIAGISAEVCVTGSIALGGFPEPREDSACPRSLH
jgi:hypothetical protein